MYGERDTFEDAKVTVTEFMDDFYDDSEDNFNQAFLNLERRLQEYFQYEPRDTENDAADDDSGAVEYVVYLNGAEWATFQDKLDAEALVRSYTGEGDAWIEINDTQWPRRGTQGPGEAVRVAGYPRGVNGINTKKEDKMVEIPKNVYSPEADPEVDRIVGILVDKLKSVGDVCIYRECEGGGGSDKVTAPKHIAIEVGKRFSSAGYYVYLSEFSTGCFNFLEISKRPVDSYPSLRKI